MEDFIQKLKDNPSFREFEEFIVEKVNELDNIDDLEGLTNERAGEEAKLLYPSQHQ